MRKPKEGDSVWVIALNKRVVQRVQGEELCAWLYSVSKKAHFLPNVPINPKPSSIILVGAFAARHDELFLSKGEAMNKATALNKKILGEYKSLVSKIEREL